MDYDVIWSPEALDDVEKIAAYIHKDSPYYAQTVVEQIKAASASLNQQPLRGRRVPELEDDRYRERFIYHYRMIYYIEARQVEIVAVIHGSRLLENVERFNALQ